MLNYVRKCTALPLLFITLTFISCKEYNIEPQLFGAIEGMVLDAETTLPVSDAQVSTTPPTNAITTDSHGNYFIENIPVGEYSISIKKNGYIKSTISVTVRENTIAKATTLLETDPLNNQPPGKPSSPFPADESVDQPIFITLAWMASDPNENDSLLYNVYLFESNQTEKRLVASDFSDTSVVVSDLKYNTTYYWQVIVKDTSGAETNGNIWTFRTVNMPDLPIVFASKKNGNYEIYLSDTLSSNVLKITNHSDRDWYPRFNPRGDQIAFISSRDDKPQIFRMNSDGSGLYRITTIPVAGYHNNGIGFSWSSDGSRIIYSNYDKLYSIDLNGGGLKQIATAPQGRHFRECNWSPQGDKIAVLTIGQNIYDSEIYIMKTDGSDMSLLVDNLPGIIESPAFSPDGKSIVYSKDISGTETQEGRQLDSHLFIINIATKTETDLSSGKQDGTNDLYPRFSPDGARIIFTNTNNTGSDVKNLYTLTLKDASQGRNRVKILSDSEMADWR